MQIDLGDVPTWLAVAVASYGGYLALRQLRLQGEAIKSEFERSAERDKLLDGQLRELQQREISLEREQAEGIDVMVAESADLPGKTIVTVINGSRRPIRYMECELLPHRTGDPVSLDYCAEMTRAGFPIDAPDRYVFPKEPERAMRLTSILALRAGGWAGFQFSARWDVLFFAKINFTDDAGRSWILDSDLSLTLLGTPEDPAMEIVTGTAPS